MPLMTLIKSALALELLSLLVVLPTTVLIASCQQSTPPTQQHTEVVTPPDVVCLNGVQYYRSAVHMGYTYTPKYQAYNHMPDACQ